jgi:hypothetical protein
MQLLPHRGREARKADDACVLQKLRSGDVLGNDEILDGRLGAGYPTGQVQLRGVKRVSNRAK